MPASPQAEALVQLARKRRILDRAGCARLRILLAERGVVNQTTARDFLEKARLLPVGPAQQLLQHVPPPEGMALGPYRVLAHLADGGMGSVWLAVRDPALTSAMPTPTPAPTPAPTPNAGSASVRRSGEWAQARPLPEPDRLVVVKTMKGQFAGLDEVRRRFNRECRYMAEINHPSVVGILDHGGTEDGTLYMVLEFVETGDLKELVEQSGALPEAMALSFVHQVADALDEAHRRRLIHRDIKPANIFASPEGTCKLADFGIARSTSAERTQLTMEGTLVGSPAYMSPEQVMADKDLDIRSDLYALGCVLYYCLTGKEPYKGRLQEVLHAHRTAPIPDPRAGRPEITAKAAGIVQKLMAKKREERFQVPSELRTAIADALAALGTGGAAVPAMPAQTLDRTITCDLLAEDKPPGSTSDSHPTVKVGADGAADVGATMAVSAGEWGAAAAGVMTSVVQTPAPVATAPQPPPGESLQGDFSRALQAPWIALVGDGCHILLYARRQVTLGKLCEAPVDICLRKHPTTAFRDDCLRISRQHLQLRMDAPSGRLLLGDLGSGNGTVLDGSPLPANSPHAIEPGSDHRLMVAGALNLTLRAHARQGEALTALAGASGQPGDCGLDCQLPFDNAVISRPDNRPGMAYALVLRRLRIGGGTAELALPQASGAPAELALFAGRWIWRPGGGAWQPLSDGLAIEAGGKRLKARAGGYDIFQTES
ncbi:MAG: protein kinase [Planctomycetes bacterium]|nr:protein kinase [Planctomycetota bacterium]